MIALLVLWLICIAFVAIALLVWWDSWKTEKEIEEREAECDRREIALQEREGNLQLILTAKNNIIAGQQDRIGRLEIMVETLEAEKLKRLPARHRPPTDRTVDL